MKIHLIKEKTIRNFVLENPSGKIPFEDWVSKLKSTDWNNTSDIKATFRSADLLGNGTNRVVFDIGGNNFRMICKYAFGETEIHLFVCWIGLHRDYDRLCADKKQYSINLY